MTEREVLIKARERIARGWCQGAVARDENNIIVSADSPNATQWCLTGSMFDSHVWSEGLCPGCAAYQRLTRLVGPSIVPAWNDNETRTQEEVLALVGQALEALSGG